MMKLTQVSYIILIIICRSPRSCSRFLVNWQSNHWWYTLCFWLSYEFCPDRRNSLKTAIGLVCYGEEAHFLRDCQRWCLRRSGFCSLRSFAKCSLLRKKNTNGMYGALSSFLASLAQSMDFNQGWSFTSSIPSDPSLWLGFLIRRPLMKSADSLDQPRGISSRLIDACLARIWSLISFLFLPI